MKRIEELDFARMLSMVAVILIHVTSTLYLQRKQIPNC